MKKRIILGVTGASGCIYATRLAMHLKNKGHEVHLIPTQTAKLVIDYEKQSKLYDWCDKVFQIDDFFEEAASGSSSYDGMAIVPCSMGTLAKVSTGVADNLLVRSADVCLKENRPLVIVPREMPYNLLHLENMVKLFHARACIVSASPAFYRNPTTIEELVDTVIAKVLSHLKIEHDLSPDWKGHHA